MEERYRRLWRASDVIRCARVRPLKTCVPGAVVLHARVMCNDTQIKISAVAFETGDRRGRQRRTTNGVVQGFTSSAHTASEPDKVARPLRPRTLRAYHTTHNRTDIPRRTLPPHGRDGSRVVHFDYSFCHITPRDHRIHLQSVANDMARDACALANVINKCMSRGAFAREYLVRACVRPPDR